MQGCIADSSSPRDACQFEGQDFHYQQQRFPDHNACCREAVRSSNAAVVLQTLVPQAREIFKLLAQAQLSGESEEEGSEGVPNVSHPALHQESLEPF